MATKTKKGEETKQAPSRQPRTADNQKRAEGKSADKARGPGKSKGRVAHTGTDDPDLSSGQDQRDYDDLRRRNPQIGRADVARRTLPPEELEAGSDERKEQDKAKADLEKIVGDLEKARDKASDPVLTDKLRETLRVLKR